MERGKKTRGLVVRGWRTVEERRRGDKRK